MPIIDNNKDVDESLEAYQLAREFYQQEIGYDYIPNGVLAHMVIPQVGKAVMNLMLAVLKHENRVSPYLKMLIANMTSYAVGCTYCQTNTYEVTKNMTTEEEKLATMWEYETSPLFSDAERAALDLALAASSSPSGVTDEHRENLKAHFDEAECAEIVATIAAFSYFQKWNDTNGTKLEQHVVGIANQDLLHSGHLNLEKYAALQR